MTDPFKWRHYEDEIILTCVRWYLRYALSYRDLEGMMTERDLSFIAYSIRIPLAAVQQPLGRIRRLVAHRFGQLPAVLAFHRRYQPMQIPDCLFSCLLTPKERGKATVKGFKTVIAGPETDGAKIEVSTASWIRTIPVKDRLAVDVLLDELDLGEAETIVLARELGADLVLMDEKKGRRKLTQLSMPKIGTLGILLKAKQRSPLALTKWLPLERTASR